VETIGSKRSYTLTWCMPNNDDDDDESILVLLSFDELDELSCACGQKSVTIDIIIIITFGFAMAPPSVAQRRRTK